MAEMDSFEVSGVTLDGTMDTTPSQPTTSTPRKTCNQTVKEPIICARCGKGYSSVTNLRTHVRLKHEDTGCFKCQICHKSFISRSTFHGHVNTHNNVKPFKCSICKKCYSHEDSLKAHMKHCPPNANMDRPVHRCPHCQKVLKNKKTLREHVDVLHTSSALKYPCECGMRFKWRSSLRKHRINRCLKN